MSQTVSAEPTVIDGAAAPSPAQGSSGSLNASLTGAATQFFGHVSAAEMYAVSPLQAAEAAVADIKVVSKTVSQHRVLLDNILGELTQLAFTLRAGIEGVQARIATLPEAVKADVKLAVDHLHASF